MTAQELMKFINEIANTKGIDSKPPDHLDIDPITYANVCQFIFDNHREAIRYEGGLIEISVLIGINNGIIFKGIELILKERS